MTSPIPLAEQIAAVERTMREFDAQANEARNRGLFGQADVAVKWRDRLAAALATLRGLLLIEETR